jgi:hypothetical protein
MVFPNGIRMRSSSYQQLVLRTNGTLPRYQLPPVIRDYQSTVIKYRMDDGRKIPTEFSSQGELYVTSVSTCTEEFQKRFEYIILPSLGESVQVQPTRSSRIGPIASSSSSGSSSDSCRTRTTKQYKCVPFNEDTDLSGNVVIPGSTTLEDVLKKQKESRATGTESSTSMSISTETLEGIIGGSIGGILLIYMAYRGVQYIFHRPT